VDAQQDPADGGYAVDARWAPVQGWLRIYSTAIGLTSTVHDMYCTDCKVAVLAILGYPTINYFESMVKEYEELSSRTSYEDTEPVPFYLLEEEKESN
jgi:hypothetical protein